MISPLHLFVVVVVPVIHACLQRMESDKSSWWDQKLSSHWLLGFSQKEIHIFFKQYINV